MITMQDAVKVVKKFDLVERKGKHLFYKLVWDGETKITTAIPNGRGDLHVRNQFRNQLHLQPHQLDTAVKCTFKKSDYIRHLREIGILPEED